MSQASLFFEIGTEEIPARFLASAEDMLENIVESKFKEYFIGYSDLKVYVTPRRLAVIINGLPARQNDRIKEVFGPPRNAAFDKDGNPTKAAEGFAGTQGISADQLVIKKRDKGEYVVAVIAQKGVEVRCLLPEILREVLLSLHFPKAMRWGDGNLRFVRPIHWITTLLDTEIIPLEIDGIKSGNATRGHRFLSPGAFVIREIASYVYLMENNFVIADQRVRRKLIEEGIIKLAANVKGQPVMDEELLDAVTYLVEYPVAVLCEFPEKYLELPGELLVTVMKDHQKFFALSDEAGRLKNHFIVISNTKAENSGTIKTGAERVIKARLEDARFYYKEDSEKTLYERVQDLKRVTFHDRLGTLYDKTERVVRLAVFLAEKLLPESIRLIERAAWLCKADLITGVVSEFPELQGLIGRYYALNDKEDIEVAEAIKEQYLPAYSGGRLPETDAGVILSLADKLDNIVSFFAIGLIPTGSEDPFALRRHTLGVIAILMNKGCNITLKEALKGARKNIKDLKHMHMDDVLAFFLQRLEQLLLTRGHEPDMIKSLLNLLAGVPLSEAEDRLKAVKLFSSDAEYNSLLLAMKRINNIIPDIQIAELRDDLLSEESEKALYSAFRDIKPAIARLLKNGKYHEAIKSLSTLIRHVNAFFDGVMVMDKREEIKMNRIALLQEIWGTSLRICDFSKLNEKGQ